MTLDRRIVPAEPDDPRVVPLLAELDRYLAALYPPESNHGLSVAALRRPEVRFVTAVEGDAVLGCGALVLADGAAEIKRMYVVPAARGRGVGRELLDHLEGLAVAAGCRQVRLETGVAQPEALTLYERAGYSAIGPFADYRPDPLSRFMAKPLDPALGRASSFP